MFLYLFLLKYGRDVVLADKSLVNVPGFVVSPTVKFFALLIPITL